MDYHQFITIVERATGLSREAAERGTQATLQMLADRAKLDPDSARRATEAVLETLAERIAPGEVDDLIARLPVELHSVLKSGKARNPGRARHMPLEEFLELVAKREGAPPARRLPMPPPS